jgi:hypothetical protein
MSARYAWALLATAMRACAEVRTVSLPPGAGDQAELRKDLESRAAAAARWSPLHDAYAAMFAAEASRADGSQTVASWDAAAAAWEAVGQPYPLAYALARAAAAAAAGNRDEAAIRLHRAAELAGQLAAEPLQQQISQLARRARITLPSPGGGGGDAPFGLTTREQEVLRLVARARQPRHRSRAIHLPPDRQRARLQHPQQAPRHLTRRGRRRRPPAPPVRPALTATASHCGVHTGS